jgi:hypothetical protein
MVYVVPTNVLGKAKQEECKKNIEFYEKHNLRWTTLHKLIGQECTRDGKLVKCMPWKDEYNHGMTPDVIFFDEATMMSRGMLAKAFEMHASSLSIVAGDMEGKQWFQCRNGDGREFMQLYDFSAWPVKKFTNDWRASGSPRLMKFKSDLRNQMRKWCGEGGRVDCALIENWLRKNVEVVSYSDAVRMFEVGDFWIDPVNAMSTKLLEDGVCSGYKCRAGMGTDGKMKDNGEIVSEDVGKVCEKKGCLTVHSVQGLTRATGKLFISLKKNFEYAMAYTAISRAVSWEQLVFVDC